MDADLLGALDTISQWGVGILCPLAIFLVAIKNRWGFVFGLFSQPFWFILLRNDTGGLIASVAFTFNWALGIYEWFVKNEKMNEKKISAIMTYDGLKILTKKDMDEMDEKIDKFIGKI